MSSERPRILLVDDDRSFRRSTAELLREDGYRVMTAADGREAGEAVARESFDLILLDLRMPGADGLRIVEVLRTRGERTPILMISGFGTVDAAVEALHLGADDFLTKPVDPDELSDRVAALLERRPARRRHEAGPGGLVGRAPVMTPVFEAIEQVAPADTTVLITGETGTGKELVARGIHDLSPRKAAAFLPVNCAALAEGVLESELFGHRRGAFTGAVSEKPGLFRAAHRGTLFLDEVGDMSLRLQQRLLRVLQEREVTPVGGTDPVRVDVRVVAATHRDLKAEMEAGRFRRDLFYRLHVFHIRVPPLRERRSDIPLLVQAALRRLRERSATPVPDACSPFAMRLLRAYGWPGNVRELFAAVESAAIRARGERIRAEHLPEEVREAAEGPSGGAAAGDDGEGGRYRAPARSEDERAAILTALEEADGVRSRAADLLGMSRTTLWRKMKEYGIGDGSSGSD